MRLRLQRLASLVFRKTRIKVSNKKVRFEDDRCRVLLFHDGESVEYLSLRLDKEPLSLSLGREKSQKTQIRVRLRVL